MQGYTPAAALPKTRGLKRGIHGEKSSAPRHTPAVAGDQLNISLPKEEPPESPHGEASGMAAGSPPRSSLLDLPPRRSLWYPPTRRILQDASGIPLKLEPPGTVCGFLIATVKNSSQSVTSVAPLHPVQHQHLREGRRAGQEQQQSCGGPSACRLAVGAGSWGGRRTRRWMRGPGGRCGTHLGRGYPCRS